MVLGKNTSQSSASIHTPQEGQTQLRTYKGNVSRLRLSKSSPSGHTLTLSSMGFLVHIPVNFTHMLAGIKKGQYIEIDTEATVGLYVELVKRVRIEETALTHLYVVPVP